MAIAIYIVSISRIYLYFFAWECNKSLLHERENTTFFFLWTLKVEKYGILTVNNKNWMIVYLQAFVFF